MLLPPSTLIPLLLLLLLVPSLLIEVDGTGAPPVVEVCVAAANLDRSASHPDVVVVALSGAKCVSRTRSIRGAPFTPLRIEVEVGSITPRRFEVEVDAAADE